MQPESAKPVQDAALLWSAGLGLARRLGLGLGAGLGVRQGLGLGGGRGKGRAVLEGRVGVQLGTSVEARDYGTLGGQGQNRGREGG